MNNKVYLSTLRHNEQFKFKNSERFPLWEVNVPGTSLVVIRQVNNRNKQRAIDGSTKVVLWYQ